MGDLRYHRALQRVYEAPNKARAIAELDDDEVVQALAALSREEARRDPYVANVLATEAMNRMRRARTVARNLVEGVIHVDAQNRILEANPAALRLLGCATGALRGEDATDTVRARDMHGQRLPRELCPLQLPLHTREHAEGEAQFERCDGALIPISYTSAPVIHDDELVGAVTAFRDLRERRRALEREAFLARTGAELGATLDDAETMRNIVQLAVPTIADWATLHLLQSDGTLAPIAVAHEDPAKLQSAREYQARNARHIDDDSPLARVVRTGEPLALYRIHDDVVRAGTRDEAEFERIKQLGLRSALVVPLTARGRILGALGLVRTQSGREYDESDLEFALDVARRAALAADNAILHRQAREGEARMRAILQIMPEAVVIATRSGIEFVNDEACEVLGASPDQLRAIPMGDPRWEFEDWNGAPAASPAKLVLETGRAEYDVELSLVNARTRERRYVLASYVPVPREAGEPDALVITFTDKTRERDRGERRPER